MPNKELKKNGCFDASSKSLCGVLVLSKIFACLSVTISLIGSEGGVGGMERGGAPEREEDGEVLSTSLPNNTIPPQTPLAPPVFSPTLSHLPPFILSFLSVFFDLLISLLESVWLSSARDLHFNTSPFCLSITRTAEAIITFRSSIKHSQL